MDDDLNNTLMVSGCGIGITLITAYPKSITNSGTSTTDGITKTSFDTSENELGEQLITGAAAITFAGATTTPVVYEVKTKNNVNYDVIEKRANKIYDKYHKNHVPSSQRGKGIIIADNPDTAEICHEMFNTTFVDREHLVLNIISLLLALEEIVNEGNIPSNTKVKLEETINLLRDIKAAYTEKKIIRLSTKDDEALSFILNCFKEHQENKKNNAKKLIKEKIINK